LDYYACGNLDKTQLTTILKSIQKACELSGCSLAGGETAEMPGLYKGKDFDLAGFAVGIVDRKMTLPRVKVGDTLIALPSSGPHSNGYSLIRKIVEKEKLSGSEKNPFDGKTWAETLLAPTHIYVNVLKDVLPIISGLAHLTGGGLFGNLPRILSANQKAHIQKTQWPTSPLFDWLKKATQLSDREFLNTFNAGVGMVVSSDPKNLHLLTQHFKKFGLEAACIGQVEKSSESEPSVEWQ
jgi:phosphoribosylformylglycinamidine cyclo-ligase